ncbi:expressed unknown protein [Seminavis robusta]|uniref:Uncharacterized protein n=1 Tax=Seminavis robusta TaxID=568900 RepID=A0A9N8H3U0_9STRA|nr:expressed unknown protein [Seminavis robusta]|eukprot:Sro69_g038440.1 n/a (263) ;mRNA; r:20591-21379
MMQCSLLLLALFALVDKASGDSVALLYRTSERKADCEDPDDFLTTTSIEAFRLAGLMVSENTQNWEEDRSVPGGEFGPLNSNRHNGNGHRALAGTEDFEDGELEDEVEMYGDFLDVMNGASPGHRRLCDKDCRRLCISSSYSFAAACACCSCCGGRRRSLFGYLRNLIQDDAGLVAYNAARIAVGLLETEAEKGADSKVPACLDPVFHVEAVIQDDVSDDAQHQGRGISNEKTFVASRERKGRKPLRHGRPTSDENGEDGRA